MDTNDDLGPLLIAPPAYLEARAVIRQALGFPNQRKALLIGIDGIDGAGKSSLAAWLSWQLEMPVVHLDLYVIRDSKPLLWRADEIARVLEGQRLLQRPIVVEGVLLLRALETIGLSPDLHLFVEKNGRSSDLCEQLAPYLDAYQPASKAAHVVQWSSADYDSRVARAHLRT
jgi:hypothetical protein